jgi:hypothetical protein
MVDLKAMMLCHPGRLQAVIRVRPLKRRNKTHKDTDNFLVTV